MIPAPTTTPCGRCEHENQGSHSGLSGVLVSANRILCRSTQRLNERKRMVARICSLGSSPLSTLIIDLPSKLRYGIWHGTLIEHTIHTHGLTVSYTEIPGEEEKSGDIIGLTITTDEGEKIGTLEKLEAHLSKNLQKAA